VRVANRIRTTVDVARKRNGWNDEMCEPF